jgi:error-prone DNA polymerase
VKKMAPRDIADLIVDISLFRPGPVNSDMITPFLRARHGLAEPRYPDDKLREALQETGGVVVFHEQVLRIIDVLTGCGLAEADLVRRHLSTPGGPERTAPWFRAKAGIRGFDPETIERVWEVVSAFGGFGFCKAHAAAFAIPVYQSAWLKRHHPAAFYAGVLTHDPGMYPKRVIIGDARLSGVQVLPVDVNASSGEWRTEKAAADGPAPDDRRPARWAIRFPGRRDDHRAAGGGEPPAIRCSLREVKGISDAEVERIVSGQPYTSLRDFWDRARVSRPVVERLALIGAFDSLYPPADPVPPVDPVAPAPTRRDLLARVGVLARQTASARQGTSLALDLFVSADTADGMADLVPAGELRELDLGERVEAELEILGFDVSQHVIDFYTDLLAGLNVVRSADLDDCRNGETILVAGAKVATQTPAVRSGQRIIFASLDDAVGLVDLTFFESVQDRCAARLFGSWLLLVRGRVRRAGAGPMAVTVNATECWDIPALEEIRLAGGLAAVRAALATGRDLQAGPETIDTQDLATPKNLITPGNADNDQSRDGDNASARPLVFANGFALSPYAETGAPGGSIKSPPRTLWHASPGSTNTPK